jgi:hypothetical protein
MPGSQLFLKSAVHVSTGLKHHTAEFLNVTLLYLKNIFCNTANTRTKLHKVTLTTRDKCIGLDALYIP